jgi:hypothetical protein
METRFDGRGIAQAVDRLLKQAQALDSILSMRGGKEGGREGWMEGEKEGGREREKERERFEAKI